MIPNRLLWVSSNPLGITGIIVILLLAIVFVHAYFTSPGGAHDDRPSLNCEPPYYAKWVLIAAIIIGGVWIISPYTADQPLWSRIVLGLMLWGSLGVLINEAFLRFAMADGTPPEQHSVAQAQSTGVPMNGREVLAGALNNLADAISNAGPVVIGSQSIAVAKPGSSGTVIGSQSVAIGKPGFSGTVIGSQSVASSSGTPVNAQKAQELRNGADRLRAGQASRSEIGELIAQSFLPGNNPAVNAAMASATQALQASDLP